MFLVVVGLWAWSLIELDWIELIRGCCAAVSALEFVVGAISGGGVIEGYKVKNIKVVLRKFIALD